VLNTIVSPATELSTTISAYAKATALHVFKDIEIKDESHVPTLIMPAMIIKEKPDMNSAVM
jgi:hypothetical protein